MVAAAVPSAQALQHLVAFVVPAASQQNAQHHGPAAGHRALTALAEPLQHELRQVLVSAMPALAHMPTQWLASPELPLLASGKVDRSRLAALAHQLFETGDSMLHAVPDRPAATTAAAEAVHASHQEVTAKRRRADSSPNPGDGAAQRRAAPSESGVMEVLLEVLQPLLQQRALPIEPTDSVLDLGASSLQVAAIAALLGTTPAQVQAAPSCRQLAAALAENAHVASWVPAGSPHMHLRGQGPSPRQRQCWPPTLLPTEGAVQGSAEMRTIAELANSSPQPKCEPLAPTHAAVRSSAAPLFCTEPAQLQMSDSRNEGLTTWVEQEHMPGSAQPLWAAAEVSKAALPAATILPHAASVGSGGRQAPRVLATMQACVDAPLTVLLYSCTGSGGCTCAPREWLLACSHAGEVACICAATSARAWTALVPSSPDAGGQVTACGRAFVVAAMDGFLYALSLRDGAQLCHVDTGGQLRRCVWHITAGLPGPGGLPDTTCAVVFCRTACCFVTRERATCLAGKTVSAQHDKARSLLQVVLSVQ